MGAFPLFQDSLLTLKETFAEMPASLRAVMCRGFAALGSLSEEKRFALAQEIGENINNISDTDVPELASTLGLDEESTGAIVSSTSLLIALATSRKEDPETLLRELVDARLVQEESREASLHVLRELSGKREQLQISMSLDALATQTLPSFKSINTSIDVRLEISDNGDVKLVVPVVVVGLHTDHSPTRSFFQIKSSDVRQLADKFTKLAREIEIAETWMKRT